jgi:hypothetical protein
MGKAMRILSDIASVPAREWVPLDEVLAARQLSASDVVRMALAKPRLLPRTCELHGRVWAHAPTLIDWELLLETVGFQTEAAQQAALANAEGATNAA